MKKNLFYICATTIFLLFTNCAVNIGKELQPSKNQITKKYHVNPFAKIESEVFADIIFTQSEVCKVEAQGPENYISHIVISTKDNALTIRMDDPQIRFRNTNNKNKVQIFVTAPMPTEFTQKGVGDIILKGDIRLKELSINNNGVGDIQADNLICEDLTIHSKGVGDTTLKGETNTASYFSKGVGDLKMQDMKAREVKVTLVGVGDISCYASQKITATSKGVGDINFYGNPKEKQLSKTGVGSIKER